MPIDRHGMEIISTVSKYLHPLLKKRIKKIFNGSVRSVAVAYKVHGDTTFYQTPIIVLHGFLGSKRNWESMSKKINDSTSMRVIAVDARNHGESPHESTHSYKDLASDVRELFAKLSIKEALVLGHSMGGRTAMVLALMEPKLVKALGVVDISPISTPGKHNDFFPKLMNAMSQVHFTEKTVPNAKKQAAKVLESTGAITDIPTMQFILMNVGKRKDQSIGWLCNVETLKNYHYEIASFPEEMMSKKYEGPAMFIAGEKSNYLPPSDLKSIRTIFPAAKLMIVEHAGHNVHAEEPQIFQGLIEKFIRKVMQ